MVANGRHLVGRGHMRRLVTSRPGHGLVLAATFLIAGLPGVPGAGADGRQSVRRNPRSVRQCSALIEGGGMRPTRQGSGHPLAILLVGMSLYFAVVAITLAALGHDRQLAAAVAGSLVVAAWVGPVALARVRSPSDATWQGLASPDRAPRPSPRLRSSDGNTGSRRVRSTWRALAESRLARLAAWALVFALTSAVSATMFAGSPAIAGFAVASAAVLLAESLASVKQGTLRS